MRNILRAAVSKNRGQATTEMVLLFPLFMLFCFGIVKVFALLVLVQKVEIASFYAARRWQLESHRNIRYAGYDDNTLRPHIEARVKEYLGFYQVGRGFSMRQFLNLTDCNVNIQRTQVWNVVTLTVRMQPWVIPMMKNKGMVYTLQVVKYVPNRDRPIQYQLPTN